MIEFTIDYPDTAKGRKHWAREYGLNAMYFNKYKDKRKRDAQFWHQTVHKALECANIHRHVMTNKAIITFYWNDRLDIDNHAYMGKMIVDSLKGWLIVDDDRRHVATVIHSFHDDKCIKVRVEGIDEY